MHVSDFNGGSISLCCVLRGERPVPRGHAQLAKQMGGPSRLFGAFFIIILDSIASLLLHVESQNALRSILSCDDVNLSYALC
jgi:hypothetical protein